MRLYGVGPVLIDALRICRLDRVVEVYAQGHRIEFASLFEAVSYDLVHTKTRIATPRLVGTCEHSAMTVVYADEAAALGSGQSNIE